VNLQTPPPLPHHPEYPGAGYRAAFDERATAAVPAQPRPPHQPAPSIYPTTPPWARKNKDNPEPWRALVKPAETPAETPASCDTPIGFWRRFLKKIKEVS
jgi:hypothetical protein